MNYSLDIYTDDDFFLASKHALRLWSFRNFPAALEAFLDLAECLESLQDLPRLAMVYNYISNLYKILGDSYKQGVYLLKFTELNVEEKHDCELHAWGIYHMGVHNYRLALHYFLALESRERGNLSAFILYKIAECYEALQNGLSAIAYYKKAMNMASLSHDDHDLLQNAQSALQRLGITD